MQPRSFGYQSNIWTWYRYRIFSIFLLVFKSNLHFPFSQLSFYLLITVLIIISAIDMSIK
jgi:hypothetical protein